MPEERAAFVERGVESFSSGKRSSYSPQVRESPMNISLRPGQAGGGSSSHPAGSSSPSNEAVPIHDSVRRTSSTSQPPAGAAPVGSAISFSPWFSLTMTGSHPLHDRLKKQFGESPVSFKVGAGPLKTKRMVMPG